MAHSDEPMHAISLAPVNVRAIAESTHHCMASEGFEQSVRREVFNEEYKQWLEEQNIDFKRDGLWCAGLVAWLAPTGTTG
ncbi:hypothetical protein [Variovorax sp. Sphag1AA]|uniref:hypothetical protein n=1 Tax=Variovorax sp. Sphag1AA TaxID=2587027 RepID=UPI001620301B|nr:hypothetical protein [Variovorax sp. Sphag1AA]MBB3176346.1 hypothetical protein [Variovorax sp. Sphag1AA]